MQTKRALAVAAATAVLLTGTAALTAPVALAARPVALAVPDARTASPVSAALTGMPAELRSGTVEFTGTFGNSADHGVSVRPELVIATVGGGLTSAQLRLETRAPGAADWTPVSALPGGTTGAVFPLDRSDLAAGASAEYRFRLTLAADVPSGRITVGVPAVVTDPTLPPEQRVSQSQGGIVDVTVAGVPKPASAGPGRPVLTVDGVPDAFTTGGDPRTFTVTVADRTGGEVLFVPVLSLHATGGLTPEQVKADFRTAGGDWRPASYDGGSAGQVDLLLRGEGGSGTTVALHDGESRSFEIRLSFAADTAPGDGTLALTGVSLPLDPAGGAQQVRVEGGPVAFRLAVPAAPSPTASASPVPDRPAPVPPVSPSPSPSASAGRSGSAAPAAATAGSGSADVPLASTGGGADAVSLTIGGLSIMAGGAAVLYAVRRRRPAGRSRY